MRRTVGMVACFVALLASAAWVKAQPAMDGAARAQEVAPFITADTMVVMHVDVAAIDMAGLEAWVGGMVKQFAKDPAKADKDIKEMQADFAKARTFVDEFRKAGAKDIYMVGGMGGPDQGAMIIPAAGGNVAAVQAAVQKAIAESKNDDKPEVATVGNAVVVGEKAAVEGLKNAKAVAQPELAKALAAAGGSAMQIIVLPNDQLKAMAAGQNLPKELGGGPVADLINAVSFSVLGVDAPPKLALHLIVQAKDDAGAQKLNGVATTTLGKLKEVPPLAPFAAMLTPKLDGTALKIDLSSEQLGTLVTMGFQMMQMRGGGAPPPPPPGQ